MTHCSSVGSWLRQSYEVDADVLKSTCRLLDANRCQKCLCYTKILAYDFIYSLKPSQGMKLVMASFC